jgi:hypothetical protein
MAPLLEPGMMLSFDRLSPDSRHTFDYVLGQKRALDEALDSVPTLVRKFVDEGSAPSRPLPMTTKMSADEMESLRARMREEIAAEAAQAEPEPLPQPPRDLQPQPPRDPQPQPPRDPQAPRDPQPPPAPLRELQPQPPLYPEPPLYAELDPQAASTSLAKILVMKVPAADTRTHAAAGVIEARPRTPMELTASTEVPPLARHWIRLVGISIVSWMLVLVLAAVMRWDLVGRMLQWIHAT